MFGIESIGTYIPVSRRHSLASAEKFSIDTDFLDQKIGVQSLPVKAADEDTSDLAAKAIENLVQKSGLDLKQVEALILCTQNPDGYGLPHTSAILHAKLNLSDRCAAFDISLGCSGFVYGLSVATSFAQANGFKKVLLVTADPYSKILDENDKNTILLFGDGASATLLSEGETSRYCLSKTLFGTQGKQGQALHVNENRKLFMNGRAVFNFSATVVPAQVLDLLENLNLTAEDIDAFLFHQGSRYILTTLTQRLKLDPNKVLSNLSANGNTVSSTIPTLLAQVLDQDQKPERMLISGFGVGLSYASAILERKHHD